MRRPGPQSQAKDKANNKISHVLPKMGDPINTPEFPLTSFQLPRKRLPNFRTAIVCQAWGTSMLDIGISLGAQQKLSASLALFFSRPSARAIIRPQQLFSKAGELWSLE